MPTDENERERMMLWMAKEGLMEKDGWQQKIPIAWCVSYLSPKACVTPFEVGDVYPPVTWRMCAVSQGKGL